MPDLVFKPHPKQELFASIPDDVFEALYGGAAGGGKSALLRMIPLLRKFHLESQFRGLYMRRTFPELEQAITETRVWYPHFGGVYNEDKKRWKFPSGATMRFGHAEYEQDIRKYDSDEYHYVAFDELTSFTEFQYNFLARTRVRSSSRNLPAIVRSATNPGNIGHSWVRKLFVEPAPAGTIVIDSKTTLKRIFIQALLTDNPSITENDPGYIHRLQSLPEAERRAKLDGDWYTFEGQVFEDYREQPMSDEPENACHICAPFKIPDWWLRFLAIDWGYTAMTCGLWSALSPNDVVFFYREYAHKGKKTSEWSQEIGELSFGEKYKDVVLCQSAWQNRGDELTIQEKFKKYSGLSARQADNDRISGKILLQEYLRWRVKGKSPSRSAEDYDHEFAAKVLRNQGMDAYKSYLAQFDTPQVDKVLPKMQIFPDCKELRKVLPLCVYDKKSNVTNKPAEDVREFDGDDPYDTVRYNICAVDKYLGSLRGEADHRSREDKIIQSLQETNNWTNYHMQMGQLEKTSHLGQRPVRRSRSYASRLA